LLSYVPDENYDGKDDFAFKVYDGTVFSKDAKVSIKIENNEKLGRDHLPQNDKQPKREESSQSPTNTNEKKTDDEKSNNDASSTDSNQQSTSSTQDNEQQKNDQKAEEQQSDEPDTPKSDTDTTGSGDTQPTPDS
jgi:hypothetical protein